MKTPDFSWKCEIQGFKYGNSQPNKNESYLVASKTVFGLRIWLEERKRKEKNEQLNLIIFIFFHILNSLAEYNP